jgi:hypothetical protein
MERARLVEKIRATTCDKYNNKLNLVVNLFHRDKEFENFCIDKFKFEPSSSDSEAVYRLNIMSKSKGKSFSCLYHSNMVWVVFKRYIRNIITRECCICYETLESSQFDLSASC